MQLPLYVDQATAARSLRQRSAAPMQLQERRGCSLGGSGMGCSELLSASAWQAPVAMICIDGLRRRISGSSLIG